MAMQATAATRPIEQLQQQLSQLDVSITVPASLQLQAPLHSWLVKHLGACREKLEFVAQIKADRGKDEQQDVSSSRPVWLGEDGAVADKEALAEARALEPVLQAQLQQQQALDRALSKQLQAVQDRHHRLQGLLHTANNKLSAQWAALKQLDTQLNTKLQQLQDAMEEAQQLVSVRGASWLLVAADMAQYQRMDTACSQYLAQLTNKLELCPSVQRPSSLSMSMMMSSRASQQEPTQPAFLDAATKPGLVNPFGSKGCDTYVSDQPQVYADMTPAEREMMRQELARLRYATCLGEMEEVLSAARVAGLRAQVLAIRQMMSEQQSSSSHGSYAPWLHPAECDRLASRVHALQKELSKLSESELPALIDKVAQLQDTFVLKGDCEVRAARQAMSIADKQEAVRALLAWGAQSLVLDMLRTHELAQLSALYNSILDMTSTLSDLLNAYQQRCDAYAEISYGGTAGAGSSHSTHDTPSRSSSSRPQSNGGFGYLSSAGRAPSGGGAGTTARHRADASMAAAGVPGRVLEHPYLEMLHGVLQQEHTQASASATPATLKSMTTAVQQLQARTVAAQAAVTKLSQESLPQVVSGAVSAAQAAHALLCGPGAPDVTPIMVEPATQKAQQELEGLNLHLQDATNGVVVACNAFISYSSRNQEQAKLERSVFELFHTNPEQLLESVNQLQKRLDALQ